VIDGSGTVIRGDADKPGQWIISPDPQHISSKYLVMPFIITQGSDGGHVSYVELKPPFLHDTSAYNGNYVNVYMNLFKAYAAGVIGQMGVLFLPII